ncbi:hypothetical protein E4K72_18005 [Oxalobacteraceae bacterium OM1]|nr:hypothetical protein E4K72_18005 [Oxalobacteraceae bacterium OM1]
MQIKLKRTQSQRHSIDALLALLTLSASACASAQSGIYESLLIGVDHRTGAITAAYHEVSGGNGGPLFSCIFGLKGKVNDSIFTVGFPGQPERSTGVVRFSEHEAKHTVFIRLKDSQPGCTQATPVDFLGGDHFEQSQKKNWHAVSIVVKQRTYFHDAPDAKRRRKSYLVYGDCVGILEIRGEWKKVEFLSGNRAVIGWVNGPDVQSI